MASNQGTAFERRIAPQLTLWKRQGRAKIEKVDPPSLTRGFKTILLPNPFLDYAGTWTEMGGRTIIVEAKHTDKSRLDINRKGGITEKQWSDLKKWKAAGAECFILWEHPTSLDPFELRILTIEIAAAACEKGGRVSIPWHEALKVQRGTGMNRFDWLTTAKHLTE